MKPSSCRSHLIGLLLCLAALPLAAHESRGEIAIVVAPDAPPAERIAAGELRDRLQQLYPGERFVAATAAPPSGRIIIVASQISAPGLLTRFVGSNQLAKPESFVVSHRREGECDFGIIAGADPRGTSYGVYALLEKLGCGFYLSFETQPPARQEALTFDDWELADAPLFKDRITLDWHNFLSSATTWEFADWQHYIDAAVRLRFNDLMVHAYGNNPMFTFTFNGVTKPVGYFATTERGRDWGTQHVNDVRRLVGGEVFSEPVFGASIAKGDPAQRVEATGALMKQVFAAARARGLGVTFALDVDTLSANPQEIIRTLPASARFTSGKLELANPDTPEGFAYYKAQFDQLLGLYPEITRIAVWFRSPESDTPWRRLKRSELPAAWQREFKGPDEDVSAFALAKIVHAFRRAVQESGRSTTLAAGSWAFPFLEASDRYIDREVPLIALDWWVSFDSVRAQHDLLQVQAGRKVIPILWAHHDDSTYIGRSYTPWAELATKLERIHAAGYGVVHWTTRPLDLYFKSTVAQTWELTKDQPLATTCEEMATRIFGANARAPGGRYLFSWVTESPMFGRETSASFVDRPLPTPELHAQRGQTRLEQLARIYSLGLTPSGTAHLRYFQDYEKFVLAFFASQTAVERADAALKRGDLARAREEVGRAEPEAVIRDYVAAARIDGITRGEQAIVVSLNLRWLPHVLSLRQAIGLDPVRYRLGEVQQEPLAQGAAPNTYYFDEQRRLWKVIDATGKTVLRLSAISGDKLAPDRYLVTGLGELPIENGVLEYPVSAEKGEIVITPVHP